MAEVQYMGHTQQHDGETISYTIDVSNFDTPANTLSHEVLLFKDDADAAVTEDNTTDVTATIIPSGSPAAATTNITTAPLTAMTIGQSYRVYTIFKDNSSNGPFRRYFVVECVGES